MKNKVKKLLLEVSKYMQPRDEINIWNRDGQIEVQYCPAGNVPTNYILDEKEYLTTEMKEIINDLENTNKTRETR